MCVLRIKWNVLLRNDVMWKMNCMKMMRMISFLDDSFLFKEERKGRIKGMCTKVFCTFAQPVTHLFF